MYHGHAHEEDTALSLRIPPYILDDDERPCLPLGPVLVVQLLHPAAKGRVHHVDLFLGRLVLLRDGQRPANLMVVFCACVWCCGGG